MGSFCNNAIWSALENHLVPPAPTTRWYYSAWLKNSVVALFLFPVGVITGCFAGVEKMGLYALSFFRRVDHQKDFSAVLDDSRLWQKLEDIEQSLITDPLDLELMGTATCEYQASGRKTCPDSQWADWEKVCIKDPNNRSDNIPSLFKLCQTREGRKELIDRLKKLNINAFRFSIEWSLIMPEQTKGNIQNLQTYVDLCKDLRDAGIEVMLTLHHFSEPKWFHELGSFEKEENIEHFIEFALTIRTSFTMPYKDRPLVEYYCTINEPAIDAFSRYVLGTFSPGSFLKFARAGNFLKNALKAHSVVYELFKTGTPPSIQVGIVHQYLRFIPKNFLLIPVARYFTRLVNEAPMNFFKNKGKFELKIPFLCNIQEQCPEPKTDFVGLQYYGRPVIGPRGSTSYYEPMTKMPMREDPEGLYEAAIESHRAFNVPIIVTENGISTDIVGQRRRYMARALYALREAAKVIGKEKVRGYFVWSLARNLEWNMGMHPQDFGVYKLTEEGLEEDPKQGILPFTKIAKVWLSKKQQLHKEVA